MALPSAIAALIETFAANESDYTASEFKEAQVRQQFIDPFFAALGWDVANTAGYSEAYKEVMHEDALKIGGEIKAPDYSFRIGGNRKDSVLFGARAQDWKRWQKPAAGA